MQSESLKASEALSAKDATHPRVSVKSMEDKIVAQHFINLGDALAALGHPVEPHGPLSLMTICAIQMQNGFTVIGKSAPASPENFDAEKGKTFAYEDAIKQLWPLEGYALRDRLAACANSAAA